MAGAFTSINGRSGKRARAVEPARLAAVGAMVLVSLLVAVGCGGSSSTLPPPETATDLSSSQPSSTTTSSASTAPDDSAEEQAFKAYVAAMDAYAASVADPPNPDNAELQALVGEPLLSEFRKVASEWRGFGQAVRYPPQSVHRTTLLAASVDGDKATLKVCSVDDSELYEPSTGTVLNDKTSTNEIEAILVPNGDGWKLTERTRLQQWEGVAGCAVDQP